MKKLLVANWKMNLSKSEITQFFDKFNHGFTNKREAWIAPQAIYFSLTKELKHSDILIGLQNCSEKFQGAYTGEISPAAIKDMDGGFVILGHSERRHLHDETSKKLNEKIRSALEVGLKVIYCVGETLPERESGQTLSIISDQIHQGLNDQSKANLDNLIIAYEPIWAIGTGKTASPAQAQEVHAHIRNLLIQKFPTFGEKLKLLYGGSVKPDNIEELLGQKDIDGGLVGGASLKPLDFLALCGNK